MVMYCSYCQHFCFSWLQSITMVDAMNEGRVIMEFVSKRKIREEKNSYGLITIKITKVRYN